MGNVLLHASRAPWIWDHELWDMLTELVVVVAIVVSLRADSCAAAAEAGPKAAAASPGVEKRIAVGDESPKSIVAWLQKPASADDVARRLSLIHI